MEETMEMANEVETVSTVQGFVPLSKLGIILPHEHIRHKPLSTEYRQSSKPKIHPFLNTDYDFLINRGHYKMYPYTAMSKDISLIDDEIVKNELNQCKSIDTIVENTSYGLMRDISQFKNFSEHSKINIIAGTGFYAANVQEKKTLSLSQKKMYNVMKRDLTENCLSSVANEKVKAENNAKILAGFIGAVGISSPIHAFEKRSICATAEVQEELGCPVSFSPAMGTCDYTKVLRIYEEAGGNANKAVVTHVDCTLIKKTELMEFLDDTKCYIQFSMFGDETSFNHRDDNLDMLSDAQRIKRLKLLKDNKQLHRVLISHDIHTEERMSHYGGHGFTHISKHIREHMLSRGLSTEDFETLTKENPQTWLFWNQKSKI
nr:PREDICTED: phosphotriesterase-related protein-like [Linepithema humile]